MSLAETDGNSHGTVSLDVPYMYTKDHDHMSLAVPCKKSDDKRFTSYTMHTDQQAQFNKGCLVAHKPTMLILQA